jgi:hypothetical protein
MDLAAPFRPEVLRPIVTVVVPGTIACGPFTLIAGYYMPVVEHFWTVHPTAFSVLLTLAVIAFGFMIDDIGSDIEYHFWDHFLAKRDPQHKENWDRYLQLRLRDEIIGQRYLRVMLTQLKFELAMAPALAVFGCGIIWLNEIYQFFSWQAALCSAVVLIAAIVYFLFESWQTAGVLSRTRALIVKAVDERGGSTSPQPAQIDRALPLP